MNYRRHRRHHRHHRHRHRHGRRHHLLLLKAFSQAWALREIIVMGSAFFHSPFFIAFDNDSDDYHCLTRYHRIHVVVIIITVVVIAVLFVIS